MRRFGMAASLAALTALWVPTARADEIDELLRRITPDTPEHKLEELLDWARKQEDALKSQIDKGLSLIHI